MFNFWINSIEITNSIYIPKYYDKQLSSKINSTKNNYVFNTIRELCDKNIIKYETGHEIGKAAYGTGDIPFVRTRNPKMFKLMISYL